MLNKDRQEPGEAASNHTVPFDRRDFLQAVSAGVAGTALLGMSAASATEPSVGFESQQSDGNSVDVTIWADIESILLVINAKKEVLGDYHFHNPEEDSVEVAVTFSEPLKESKHLEARLVTTGDNSEMIASDSAFVSLGDDGAPVAGLDPTLIEANPEAGFNYPYFLYAPDTAENLHPAPLLVQPNNTGYFSDDLEDHIDSAEQLVQPRGPRAIGDALNAPVLVPVFPRPESDPVDWTHYVHALDTETLHIEEGDLERVDLQLLNMIEHATDQELAEISYPVGDEIMLDGFSASGTFVNRFTALHPEIVRSVTAGGVNGTLILPKTEAAGHTLDYQIGIADLESITGDGFNAEAWNETDQLVYMGGDDENDTIPYDDAWNDEQRAIALDVYGDHMQEDRMPYCKSVYNEHGAAGRVKVFPNVGHQPVTDELIDFHRRSLGPAFVEFATPPSIGSSTVEITARSRFEENAVEARVFSNAGDDLTDSPITLEGRDAYDGQIELTEAVKDDNALKVALVSPSASDPADAIVSQEKSPHGHVAFDEEPVAGETTVSVEYELSDAHDGPLTLRVDTEQGGSTVLHQVEPGDTGVISGDLDEGENGVPLEQTRELSAVLVEDDPQALDPVAVGSTSIGEPTEPAFSLDIDAVPVIERGDMAPVYVAVRALGGSESDLDDVPVDIEVEGEYVDTVTVAATVGETTTGSIEVPTQGDELSERTVSATAAENTESDTVVLADKPSGSGTAEDPYVVTSASEFAYGNFALNSQFELAEDIDCSGYSNFVPIGHSPDRFVGTLGNSNTFTGVVEGNGHEIADVTIDLPELDDVGLFTSIRGAEISNLRLENADIRGADFVGGIIGSAHGEGQVNRVSVAGTVEGESNVGGIVGSTTTGEHERSQVTIEQAAVEATVQGSTQVGGILGQSSGGPVRASYLADSTIGAEGTCGGIIGAAYFGGTLAQCFVDASQASGLRADGLVGQVEELTVEDAYWNADELRESVSGGAGLTADQLSGEDASQFLEGFDFEETWTVTESHPELAWRTPVEIQSLSVVDTLSTGDTETVSATVVNHGEEAQDDTLELRFNGDVSGATDVSLSSEGSVTVEFDLDVAETEPGTYEYGIFGSYSQQTNTVTIVGDDPNFQIDEIGGLEVATQGENLPLAVQVTNLGPVDEQSVQVSIADNEKTLLTANIGEPNLDSGESVELATELETNGLETGDYVLIVETDTNAEEREFEIQKVSVVTFAEQPEPGDTTVYVSGQVNPNVGGTQRLRIGDSSGSEITTGPATPGPGDQFEAQPLNLEREVVAGEELIAILSPPGGYNPSVALDTATTTAADPEEDTGSGGGGGGGGYPVGGGDEDEEEPDTEDNSEPAADPDEDTIPEDDSESENGVDDGNEHNDGDDDGAADDTADQQANDGSSGADTDASGTQNDSSTTGGDDDATPGFGVTGALTSIGGLGYLLKRRLGTEDEPKE